ncbi:MAG TPA: lytic transglycosylase domain-containing protein [Nitrolancea sp.]|nr:lytic transglycosylase domain-containing protein [Nitrolancea sp.]
MRLRKNGKGISGRRVSLLVFSLLFTLLLSTTPASATNLEGTWKWRDTIVAAGVANDIPPGLIQAVMAVESGGDPKALGGQSMGLMQIMPLWFQGGEDPWDPTTNINKGAQILRQCEEKAGGWHPGEDWTKAMACYNSGSIHGNVPGYVSKVRAAWIALAAQGA